MPMGHFTGSIRRWALATTTLSTCLLTAAAAAADSARDGSLDLTGAAWTAQREQRRAEALEHAATLQAAHDRFISWLAHQGDESLARDLVDHLETTGGLPPAHEVFSPLTADERDRFDGIGIDVRICGELLVSQLIAVDGHVGRVGQGEVRHQGRLAVVTLNGIEPWNGDPVTAPELATCGLTEGAPAVFGRWRSPAFERQENVAAETRISDCPDSEVGPGILEGRRVLTYADGFGAPVHGETAAEAWTELSRDCRAPRTGEVSMPMECTNTGGHRSGLAGTRVLSWPWTEERDPLDSRSVRIRVDWSSPTVVQDFCAGGASEEVDVTTVHDTVNRETVCTVFHAPEWTRGGPVGQERDRYTSDIVFPPSWNRPDEQVVALDPWRVLADDCHRHVVRSRTGETRVGSCPVGWSGSGRYQRWVETRTEVLYADPVPHRADHVLPGSVSRTATGSISRCTAPPPPDTDPDDDRPYWQDNDGNLYTGRPPGSKPTDGHFCHCGGYPRDPQNWDGGNDGGDNSGGGNGGGGGCFLTTAVAGLRDEEDDGPTLTTLRGFRDGWLSDRPGGRELIAEYYELAPSIVAAIPAGHCEWCRIADEVDLAATAVRNSRPEDAFEIYCAMVRRLTAEWLS